MIALEWCEVPACTFGEGFVVVRNIVDFGEKNQKEVVKTRRGGSLTGLSHEDGNDHAVHAQHTGHDDWDDRFEEQVRLDDADRDDTDSRLGCTVGCAHVGKDKGEGDANRTEEHGLIWVAQT